MSQLHVDLIKLILHCQRIALVYVSQAVTALLLLLLSGTLVDGWMGGLWTTYNGQEEAFVPDVNSTMEGHRHHPGRNEGLCERDGRQKYEEEEEEVVA